MKKIGTSMLLAGMIILIAVSVKSLKDMKNHASAKENQRSQRIPWPPLVGAVLVASGVIMMSTKERS